MYLEYFKTLLDAKKYYYVKSQGLVPDWFEEVPGQYFVALLEDYHRETSHSNPRETFAKIATSKISDDTVRAGFLMFVDKILKSKEIGDFLTTTELYKNQYLSRLLSSDLLRVTKNLGKGDYSTAINQLQELTSNTAQMFGDCREADARDYWYQIVADPLKAGLLTGFPTIDAATSGLHGGEFIALMSGPGEGKCFGRDTEIMMYDGSVKMVQDICIGDKVFGDDRTPRTVLEVHTGVGQLYKIKPLTGKPFITNGEHILAYKVITGDQLLHQERSVKELFLDRVPEAKFLYRTFPKVSEDTAVITLTAFTIQSVDLGEYFGFETDGNHLFCLADGTVVHNSTLLQNIGFNIFTRQKNVIYMSVEMPLKKLYHRFLSMVTGIPNKLFKTGGFTPEQQATLDMTVKNMLKWPSYYKMIDSPIASPALVEAKIKDQETKPDLVIIDYLAIMQVSSKEKKSWEAISQLTVELRALARKYDIPFMTAVQVNRDAVDKPKEFYEQQDIAMSFPIIQHSDIVISTKIPDRDVLLASPHCNMNAKFVKDRDGENRTFIITADFSTFRMEEPSIGHKFSSPGGEVRPAAPEAGKQ